MPDDLSASESTVVATYSTRRDAEMAADRLEEDDIQAFVATDDAGGMHPELQPTHGVKVVVLSDVAPAARETLAEAGLLSSGGPTDSGDQVADTGGASRSPAIVAGIVLVITLLVLALLVAA